MNLNSQNKEDMTYELSIEGDLLQAWMIRYQKEFGGTYQTFKNYGIQYIQTSTTSNLTNLTLAYEDLFQNTYYLAPLREYPKRTYLWSGERPQDVGKRGELTVAALLASRKKDLEVEIAVAKS
jgi:hypothetical protein